MESSNFRWLADVVLNESWMLGVQDIDRTERDFSGIHFRVSVRIRSLK